VSSHEITLFALKALDLSVSVEAFFVYFVDEILGLRLLERNVLSL